MRDLKILIYQGNESSPETTLRIPGNVLRFAVRLLPKRATAALHENGIDLDELVRLAAEEEAVGTLLEIEDHRDGERIVIRLD